ncbi:MAG: hypothetical protein WEC75_10700 [Dehalococcoidia bacterium]
MPFFVAVALIATLSSLYLIHQFWTRSLAPDEPAETAAPEAEASATTLKAA